MTQIHSLQTADLKHIVPDLRAGDRVILSGIVYTARDAAHKRLIDMLDEGKPLPFDIYGATIYYAGPTPTPPGRVIGSCGPTTSSRMDAFTPRLLSLGLAGMIGKGDRSASVAEALSVYGAVYFCAVGGAGALISRHITGCEEIAFSDLGCESVKKLRLDKLPLTVGIDSSGKSIFERNPDYEHA